MDGTKTIRRRTHDYEFNENSQFKRKRKRETETDNTNSVEILGESHVIFTSKNTGNNHYWSQDTSRHNTKCFFPNGTYGESRLVENIQNNNNNNSSGRRFLSSPQNGHSKEKLPNCTIGRTTAAEIHSSLPPLPPSLRESERMLHVQRWINSIPPDLPSWIQVSHNKIIPVTNPHESYAEVEDSIISEIPDCNPGCNLNSVNQTMDYYSKQPNNHSSNPSTQKSLSKIPGVSVAPPLQPPPFPPLPPPPMPPPTHSQSSLPLQLHSSVQHGHSSNNNNNNNTSLGIIPSKFSTIPSGSTVNSHQNLLTPIQSNQDMNLSNHPHQHPHQYCMNNDHNQLNYSSRDTLLSHHIDGEPNHTNNSIHNSQRHPIGDSMNSGGRLFNDMEIQMIVKLFQDYFTKGSCPMLKEVRRRIMNNFLESRRTPVGIRAKIKRLQKSGQWTDYITT
ncbi:unnamed protein product [Schistosoma haematobium]|nr:unnamed protein product [Schistosoma haematobium]